MQANMIMQNLWVLRVNRHLKELEIKKKGKSKRVLGNGLPCLCTSDAFFKAVEKKQSKEGQKIDREEGKAGETEVAY